MISLKELQSSPVIASPVGPGHITDISDAGYPKVNDVAVSWFKLENGFVFNPHGFEGIDESNPATPPHEELSNG